MFGRRRLSPSHGTLVLQDTGSKSNYQCPYRVVGCSGYLSVTQRGESINLSPYTYQANCNRDYETFRENRQAKPPEMKGDTQMWCSGCMEPFIGSLKGASNLSLENGGLTEKLLRDWVHKHPDFAQQTKEGRRIFSLPMPKPDSGPYL